MAMENRMISFHDQMVDVRLDLLSLRARVKPFYCYYCGEGNSVNWI